MKTRTLRQLPLAASLLAGLALWLAPAWAAVPLGYPTGLRPATEAEKQALGVVPWRPGKTARREALPSSVRNTLYLPPVYWQNMPNCGAVAPTYYVKTWQEAREHGWEHPSGADQLFSPDFTFPLVVPDDGAGASVPGTMAIIRDHGAATLEVMPTGRAWGLWPPEDAWRAAIPWRAQSIGSISLKTADGIQALKAHLAGGDLAAVGLLLDSDVFLSYPNSERSVSNDVVFARGLAEWTWHALTVIGYDDEREYNDGTATRHGAFLAANSWGDGWGVTLPELGTGGFVWLAYDYLMAAANGTYGETDAYTMVDRIGYEPHTFAVVGLDHPRRRDLDLFLLVGDAAGAAGRSADLCPAGSGYLPFMGRIVLDLSDWSDGRDLGLMLRIEDFAMEPDADPLGLYQPAATGTVTYFAVDTTDGLLRVCRDTPALTVDNDGDPGANPDIPHLLLAIRTLNAVSPNPTAAFVNGFSAAWGDWNNDGFPDLAAAGRDATWQPLVHVFTNNGEGGLVDSGIALTQAAGTPSWVDFDNDGLLDLAMCGAQSRLYRNTGSDLVADLLLDLPTAAGGTFAWADYDHDGFPDLAASGAGVLHNDSGRGLTPVPLANRADDGRFGTVLWGDFDSDGHPDLAYTDGADSVRIRRGNGAGAFAPYAALAAAGAETAAAADADGDGRLDLAVASVFAGELGQTREVVLFRNTGGGQFTAVTVAEGPLYPALDWGDVNQDGRPDLLVCGDWLTADGSYHIHPQTRLFLQTTTGAFVPTDFRAPSLAYGAPRFVDADGDGDLDVTASGLFLSSLGDWLPGTLPEAPAQLDVAAVAGGRFLLSWLPASDVETPTADLGYQARCGTAPGLQDLLSPAAEVRWPSGVPHGTDAGRHTFVLPALPEEDTVAYASLRTLDAQGQASDWTLDVRFDRTGVLPDLPGLPCRIGGSVTIDGQTVAGIPGGKALAVAAVSADGLPFDPPVGCTGLNPNDCYTLDLPLREAGAGPAGSDAQLRLYRDGVELDIVSPRRGLIRSRAAGAVRRVDIRAGSGPRLTSTVPADGATEVPAGTALTLVLSQPVTAVEGGLLRVVENTGRLHESVPCTSSAVRVESATVHVALSQPLAAGRGYSVEFDNHCFRNAAGVFAAGIPATRDWSFRTANRTLGYDELGRWGSQGFGQGQFDRAYGIAVGPGLHVYISERNDLANEWARVQEFSATGAFVNSWGPWGSVDGALMYPAGLACDTDGNVYVADLGNHRLQSFTSDGQHVRTWTAAGAAALAWPHGVAIGPDGRLYVTDLDPPRVYVFDTQGTHVATWGADVGGVTFTRPEWIAVAPDGRVLVADVTWWDGTPRPSRIQVVSAAGALLGTVGSEGSGDGQYGGISGLAVGPSGMVYVSDDMRRCIHLFAGDGRFLARLSVDAAARTDPPSYGALAVDAQECGYILDPVNRLVRRFSAYQARADLATEITAQRGWNLLSVPLAPAPADTVAQLFQRLDTGTYVAGVWSWDPAGEVYGNPSHLASLTGCWVRSDAVTGLLVRGTTPGGRVSLQAGWNLVGPATRIRVPSDHAALLMPVWRWAGDQQVYVRVAADDDLLPGYGYWLFATEAANLRLEER